jgi:D-amino peptidase
MEDASGQDARPPDRPEEPRDEPRQREEPKREVARRRVPAKAVFVSVDMEGVAGITTLRQTVRGTDDYEWGRRLMTEEANAAVAGSFDGGARVVVVSDSHGDMGNLLPEMLDPRAELVQGTPKLPWSMMAGIDDTFASAVFIGYHAGAGTEGAVLDHTYTGAFSEVRVNGEPWNETALNAALAGSFGVAVVFVAGDQACCDQATERLPGVHTVAVKNGLGNRVGRSRSPQRARAAIRGIVREAVRVEHPEAFAPAGPFTLEVDTANTAVADIASIAPGSERLGSRTVSFAADDIQTIYRALLTWMNLARRVTPTSAVE